MVLAIGLTASAAAEDTAKAELEKFQGEWQMVSSIRDGKEVPAAAVEKITRIIKGNHYTLLNDGKEIFKGTIKVDPSKNPKAIDAARDGNDTTALGIYELEGDMQKVCLATPGKDRPAKFDGSEGTGNTLTVWKRKK
jgi:uncharacterized protein (TIGR03067 family)